MQATIYTTFVNEKIIMIKYSTQYILFVHSHHETQDKCILIGDL